MARDRIEDSDGFVSEVCWHYFFNSMTQADIAKQMGVTRLRVNQTIARARSSGMVKIQIESPFLPRVELQKALEERFGLRLALVAPANREAHDYHGPAGAALAAYLSRKLEAEPWRKLGVSWGMSLQAAIGAMPMQSFPDLEVISMFGGTTRGATFNSFAIASGLAERLGASYSLLAAPNFLSAGVDRAAFLSQEQFQEHFAKFTQLDAAILTCSDISPRSYMVSEGLPREVTAQALIDAGAVGDVVGRFLERSGQEVPNPLSERAIGITLDVLQAVPERILVAAGRHKVEIIRAVATRGLANVLVTDDITAELLLG